MKKSLLGFAMLFLVGVAPAVNAQSAGKPLKIVLSRQSTVDPVEIIKHLGRQCPNVTITTNPKNSDYMLHAGGWSGSYRFLVIAHGGDTIYATETTLLSNAVKDVCKFLYSQPAPGTQPPPASY
jgi:hypothetical protein